MKVWDALVVGAGPAGCAAAYDLAAAGESVLLLDKAEFPRHKACAGGVTRKALRALRYPITPVVERSISRVAVEQSGSAKVIAAGDEVCVMTRRHRLDAYCLEQTLKAGASFRRIGPIDSIAERDALVEIVTGTETFSARFVVGADGVHSRVRQLAFQPVRTARGFAIEANVRVPDAARYDLAFDFSAAPTGYGWVFPRADHLNIGLYAVDPSVRLDRAKLQDFVRRRVPGLAMEDVTGQFLGFGAESEREFRRRIFLAGDAGGFVDPLTGEGIYGAIASGQAAAAAILASLRERGDANQVFAQGTKKLRDDLSLSKRAHSWWQSHASLAYRLLRAPVLKHAVLQAYADGQNLLSLARKTKLLLRLLPD
jgi:geranylgeranyl reductase family protein